MIRAMSKKANPKPVRLIFAENLREARLGLGYSQEYLAELSGLHRTYIGSVERGERNISIDNMECLAHALGTTVGALLDGEAA